MLNVVVEGCSHGELDPIYASVARIEEAASIKVDLLLCCGDFQSLRDAGDFEGMAVPAHHRHLASFHDYYHGRKVAPVLTIFIGGNHEASNYLQELHYGGWVAPNIYFLGFSGVVNVGGIRIGGLTGIYNHRHYSLGHFEAPPYSPDTLRSVYHVREYDVYKLAQLTGKVDIMMSHDWPRGIARHGNVGRLLQRKSYFREEIEDNTLGSPPAEQLLHMLKPAYWFSAHLHTKFAALVKHDDGTETRFLALDKCLPNREFLQLVSLPRPTGRGAPVLRYDPEWLAIVKKTHHLLSSHRGNVYLPTECERVTDEEIADVRKRFDRVPHNFNPPPRPHNGGAGALQGDPQVLDRVCSFIMHTGRLCVYVYVCGPRA
ncbi:putative RNA lariat debranching enzyme [Tribonema minus]|uniref:Putative RNA lariat debranching enzyme n=1 Tax=Tribonema minus TaxID=303371 RepID=A0A836CF65_9STRA|nr:putative RNA lariat debranching enzyme [Tribonema minus]